MGYSKYTPKITSLLKQDLLDGIGRTEGLRSRVDILKICIFITTANLLGE